jgi:hypothetical protein
MPAETLTLSRTPVGDRQVLVRPDQLSQSTEPRVRAEYLAVDIRQHKCDRLLAPVTVRYATLSGYTDLSERVDVPVPRVDAPFRLFFPVYYSPGSYFAGLELSAADSECIAAMRRIRDLDRTPILLNLTLPPGWQQMKLYQTLTNWERPSAPYRIPTGAGPDVEPLDVYSWPVNLPFSGIPFTAPTVFPDDRPVDRADIVRDVNGGAWTIDGPAKGRYSYLLRYGAQPLQAGTFFIASGIVEEGGFTIGLQKNNQWVGVVNVTREGPFIAVMQVQATDRYELVIANCIESSWWGTMRRHWVQGALGWIVGGFLPNRVRILRAGWSGGPALTRAVR